MALCTSCRRGGTSARPATLGSGWRLECCSVRSISIRMCQMRSERVREGKSLTLQCVSLVWAFKNSMHRCRVALHAG